MRRNTLSLCACAIVTLSAGALFALEPTQTANADPPVDHGAGRPHGPPPEAVEACQDAKAGDTCSFEHGEESIDGTCRNGPRGDETLACMPSHPPGPPQEAVTACEKLSAGDACSVVHGDQTLDGTCRSGPHGDEPLACMPAH